MCDHGIKSRDELAERLGGTGISRSTIYRAFDDTWRGIASVRVLVALAHTFTVPIGRLVHEPADKDKE